MRREMGFTLIELMIAITVGGILLTIAIPSFVNMFERNAVATTSNELLGALLYARSEAIRQELPTTFTPSASGWQVNAGATNLLTHTVNHNDISITGADVTYNARGRTQLENTQSIDISYDGTVKSHVCLSTTGRPFIRSVDDGDCP